jgi:hypothetical protein
MSQQDIESLIKQDPSIGKHLANLSGEDKAFFEGRHLQFSFLSQSYVPFLAGVEYGGNSSLKKRKTTEKTLFTVAPSNASIDRVGYKQELAKISAFSPTKATVEKLRGDGHQDLVLVRFYDQKEKARIIRAYGKKDQSMNALAFYDSTGKPLYFDFFVDHKEGAANSEKSKRSSSIKHYRLDDVISQIKEEHPNFESLTFDEDFSESVFKVLVPAEKD